MLRLPEGGTTDADKVILRKLRVWIAALAIACLVCGMGVGAMLAGRSSAVAQNDGQTREQIARAPEALSASFAEIARRVEPAVVNIDTVTASPRAGRLRQKPDGSFGMDDDEEDADTPNQGEGNKTPDGKTPDKDGKENNSENPLFEMFRRQMNPAPRGVGSGFIVDSKGYILTNNHVIDGATSITVQLEDGTELRGRVVGRDEESDLAVIKVDAGRELPTLKLGDSNVCEVGDWVLAIGSPFGLRQTVTAGIVSTKDRQAESSQLVRFIQTDAAINRGNSGGPLVNMRGEVIGVNSQIATSTGDYNGIGFAVPSNEATFVYKQLTAEGNRVRRGYLGIVLQPVRGEFARVYNLPEAKGAIVADIPDREAPAPRAGLQVGDVITEINGQSIKDSLELINKVAATPVGNTIQLTYLRDTEGGTTSKLERRTVSVLLGERPATSTRRNTRRGTLPPGHPTLDEPEAETPTPSADAAPARPRMGLRLSELTPQLANERNLKGLRGLLVRDVEDGGLAETAGVRSGTIIQRINRAPVNSMTDFERAIAALKPGDAIVLNVAFYDGERVVYNIVQFTFQ